MDSSASRPGRSEVVNVVLDGVRSGVELDDLCDAIRPWHVEGSTFPADILMDLSADAFLAVGSTRTDRLQLDGLADRLLPEWPARGNVGHQKRRHAVHGAVLIAAGAEPEDTSWWSLDDLWLHALLATVVFIRAAAERRQLTVVQICDELQSAG